MLFSSRAFTFTNMFTTSALYQGNGTENDPYLVYNEADLRKIGNDEDWTLDKSYKLMVNITLEKPAEEQSNWIPIGDLDNPFQGIFDGNNKTIKNITIFTKGDLYYEGNLDYIGFFGAVNNVNIKNLGLLDIEISAPSSDYLERLVATPYVGGIVGCFTQGKLENCHVTGNITVDADQSTVGGLGGFLDNVIVNNCYSKANIELIDTKFPIANCYCGGLFGMISVSSIETCFYSGNINFINLRGTIPINEFFTGGIVGRVKSMWPSKPSKIENCYSLANFFIGLTGYPAIGGIIGSFNNGDNVKNCYYAGKMIISETVIDRGGIVALSTRDNSVENCIVAHETFGIRYNSLNVGILGRLSQANLVDNYYLQEIITNLGTAISKEKLKKQSSYEDIGWSFSGDNPVWEFSGEYALPKLVGVGGQDDLVTPAHLL